MGTIAAVPRRRAPVDPMIMQLVQQGHGFRSHSLTPETAMMRAPSVPIFTRGWGGEAAKEMAEAQARIERGETDGQDLNQVFATLSRRLDIIQRGITSSMTAFPVRENLEAEAKILVPTETPLRNRLRRVPGAGTASQWRQATSLGGGYGTAVDQPGGVANSQAFYGESGAPAEVATVYANISKPYKLMGFEGSVTRFAMAAGANFQPQYSTEKSHSLLNLMLMEEHALVNGDSTSTAAPWGDGTNALAYDGLINLTATANGVPSAQIQTSVGPLTTAHLDAQLTRMWKQGGRGMWMMMNAQELLSMTVLAEASGTMIRVTVPGAGADAGKGILGYKITGYMHAVSGEIVDILPSRFVPAGTILFGSDWLPDNNPALDIDVLPQVEMPQLAPLENVQGYAAQELAPTAAAPDKLPFLVSVYAVLRMKAATVFAKSTGVTAVT